MSHTDAPQHGSRNENQSVDETYAETPTATDRSDAESVEELDAFIAEGETYSPEELLEAAAEKSDELEFVVGKTLAVQAGGKYISFEISELECVDVTGLDDLDDLK